MDIPPGVWAQLGYSGTPYSTTALRIQDADARLLVGRDTELKLILRDLASGAQMIALEGDYGVGKSSLAAVATSQAAGWKRRRGSPLFLASRTPLELAEADTAATLEKRAYYQVAGAILSNSDQLLAEGFKLDQLHAFGRWLSTAEGGSWSAGIGVNLATVGINVSAGGARTANNTPGFNDSGVVALIDSWLTEVVPSSDSGGVILLLDNLEVLARYTNSADLFESLRDRLFKRAGLRWIISGAEGMVRASLSTPKMSGVFPEPIELHPLESGTVQEVIVRRAEVLNTRLDAKLPVSPQAFESAYLATGQNLRFALGLADRFSLRTDPSQLLWMDQLQRDQAFRDYRIAEGKKVVEQLSRKVTTAGWRVITSLVLDKNGVSSPSDFADFGYKAMGSLLPQIQALVKLGLVTYTIDEEDGRRRLMTATENGRLAVSTKAM